jgi:hypothetical protein
MFRPHTHLTVSRQAAVQVVMIANMFFNNNNNNNRVSSTYSQGPAKRQGTATGCLQKGNNFSVSISSLWINRIDRPPRAFSFYKVGYFSVQRELAARGWGNKLFETTLKTSAEF